MEGGREILEREGGRREGILCACKAFVVRLVLALVVLHSAWLKRIG